MNRFAILVAARVPGNHKSPYWVSGREKGREKTGRRGEETWEGQNIKELWKRNPHLL